MSARRMSDDSTVNASYAFGALVGMLVAPAWPWWVKLLSAVGTFLFMEAADSLRDRLSRGTR